jgi:hypothetical protein
MAKKPKKTETKPELPYTPTETEYQPDVLFSFGISFLPLKKLPEPDKELPDVSRETLI